jgi:hypothetical protein
MNFKKLIVHSAIALTMLMTAILVNIVIPIEAQPIPLPTVMQEATPIVGSEGPAVVPSDAELEEFDADRAARAADRASRSVFDFSIAYLISDDEASTNELLSSDSITTLLGAKIISNWDAFLESYEQTPFQVILVHVSMLDQIDATWFQNAVRYQNIVILGVNVSFDQLKQLIGDNCTHDPNPEVDFENFVTLIAHSVRAEDENDREVINSALLDKCTDVEIDVDANWTNGTVDLPIMSSEGLTVLESLIIAETMNYGIPNPRLIALPTTSTGE